MNMFCYQTAKAADNPDRGEACLQTITMFDQRYRMRQPRSKAKDVIATVTTKIGQIGPGEERACTRSAIFCN